MNADVGPRPQSVIDLSSVQAWTDVLELLPDAVFLVDDDGRISYLNSRASRMCVCERGDLLNQSIDILVPQPVREHHGRHRRAYAQAPKLPTMGAGLALLGRRRDGSDFPVDVLLKPIDANMASPTIAIVRDMTERQQLEDALRKARDSAVRANEVKSRFLAAASHDLRQPLQTIWSLHSILSRALKDTAIAPQLSLLEEAVRSMDQMLSSLIDINRLEQGAIHPVIRDFALQEILPRLRSEFGYFAASKSLALQVEESTEFARSDAMLLPVILRNLLGNAIKYTQHGSVRLRVRVQDPYLYIDVVDSGPGIPREHLDRLFDAFYQIDNPSHDQRRGVGLGLSIVQTICRLLDHKVTIESSPGQGSTFTVQLPRGVVAERAAEPVARPPSAPKKRSRRITVLHVEDDPGVAKSMSMLLRLEGYDVIGAASRDEAMQQVDVHGLRPDLILCDYQLPLGITGDEIIAELAAKLPVKPPTIMLTGDIADKHFEKARAMADRILPKPVDVNLLLREIETLLGGPE